MDFRTWQPWFKSQHHSLAMWPWLSFPNSPQSHAFIWEMIALLLTSLIACVFYSVLQSFTQLTASYIFIISEFIWVRSLAKFSLILCSESLKAALKVSRGLCLTQGLDLGEVCFQAHSTYWNNSLPCNCRSEGPGFFLAIGQRQLPTLRDYL